MLIPSTNPAIGIEKIVDALLTSIDVLRNGMIVSMHGPRAASGWPVAGLMLTQVKGTTWTPKTSSIAVGLTLVSPFWMTEYMMNRSGIWSSSGRQPASGLTPRSLNNSCWATRAFIESPL